MESGIQATPTKRLSHRILPEQVLQAYKNLRMRPVQGKCVQGNTCCGLVVFIWDLRKSFIDIKRVGHIVDILMPEGYDRRYLRSWIWGFDGVVLETDHQGYEDGRDTWLLLQKSF